MDLWYRESETGSFSRRCGAVVYRGEPDYMSWELYTLTPRNRHSSKTLLAIRQSPPLMGANSTKEALK